MDKFFKISYSKGWAVISDIREFAAYDRFHHEGKSVHVEVLAGDNLLSLPFDYAPGISPHGQKGHFRRISMSFHGHMWKKVRQEPLTEADLPGYLGSPVTTDELDRAIKGKEAAIRVASRFIEGSRQ